MEQVEQFKKQKEAASLSGAIQQQNSSHAPFVALTTNSAISMATEVTNSNSSHVSSETLTTPPNSSSKPLVDFNQSNQLLLENIVSQGHSSQHSDISLASLSSSSGMYTE